MTQESHPRIWTPEIRTVSLPYQAPQLPVFLQRSKLEFRTRAAMGYSDASFTFSDVDLAAVDYAVGFPSP